MKRLIGSFAFVVVVTGMCFLPRVAYLYNIPTIQPRDFTPHGEHDCDLWPEQAVICMAGDHFYIAGVLFSEPLSSISDCRFESKDGTWTISDNGAAEGCRLNGKPFSLMVRR